MDLQINNFILEDIEKFMLYDINIINQKEDNNINKDKLNKIFKKSINIDNNKCIKSNIPLGIKKNDFNKNEYNKSKLFIPKNNDKLFWCLYILKNGLNLYNLNFNSGFSIEKELKIKAVTFMKNNEHNIKIKKTEVESNLLFDKKISIQSLSLLCNMLKMNVRLINNNFYYEFLNNESEEFKYIIIENKNYGINLDNTNENIDNKLLIINVSKPINSLSYYKVDELIQLANKLKINIKNENNKNKTKKDIYDEIYKIIYDC